MKFIKLNIIMLALCILTGCMQSTVISRTYDLSRIKRIGVIRFDSRISGVQGIEDIFAKYLLENGFTVVERARLDEVLKEQKISASGYMSPQTTKLIGRILGVDALLIGDIYAGSAGHQDIAVIETHNASSRRTTRTSHFYTAYVQVGLTAKLIDIETAEIIWIGSYTNEGVNIMTTIEVTAQYLMNNLRDDWETILKNKGKKKLLKDAVIPL